jgi:hypothetical protein
MKIQISLLLIPTVCVSIAQVTSESRLDKFVSDLGWTSNGSFALEEMDHLSGEKYTLYKWAVGGDYYTMSVNSSGDLVGAFKTRTKDSSEPRDWKYKTETDVEKLGRSILQKLGRSGYRVGSVVAPRWKLRAQAHLNGRGSIEFTDAPEGFKSGSAGNYVMMDFSADTGECEFFSASSGWTYVSGVPSVSPDGASEIAGAFLRKLSIEVDEKLLKPTGEPVYTGALRPDSETESGMHYRMSRTSPLVYFVDYDDRFSIGVDAVNGEVLMVNTMKSPGTVSRSVALHQQALVSRALQKHSDIRWQIIAGVVFSTPLVGWGIHRWRKVKASITP